MADKEPTESRSCSEPNLDEAPDIQTLMHWESQGGCEATDGCWVEPDGTCPHGCKSWMIVLGFI